MNKEEIWMYKVYYNREKVLHTMSVLLILVPVIIGIVISIVNGMMDTLIDTIIVCVMFWMGLYISSKGFKLELISVEDIKNTSWINRHRLEKTKVKENIKIFSLSVGIMIVVAFNVVKLCLDFPEFLMFVGIMTAGMGYVILSLDIILSLTTKCTKVE